MTTKTFAEWLDEDAGEEGPIYTALVQACDHADRSMIDDLAEFTGKGYELAEGLLEIAELAMPDTYLATDSRCKAARDYIDQADLFRKEVEAPIDGDGDDE